MAGIKHSDEQISIFDAIAQNNGNLLIEAGAGAGKTTTLLEGTLQVPPRNRILFCAFNKAVADELSKKAPSHVECRTTHSLALKFCQLNSAAVINAKKLREAIDEICDTELRHLKPVLYDYYRDVTSLVGLAKAYLIPPRDEPALKSLVDSLGINLSFGVLDIAYAAHTMTALDKRSIDYDEMLYFAVTEGWARPEYDVIFIDEAQDLNKAQHELLAMSLKPGGRIIGCGDQRQAIYMFRGANPDSMSLLRGKFDAKQKPLMTTWRCAQSIVALANEIIGGLKARPTAPEGKVDSIARWSLPNECRAGDFIIARTNALLVEVACLFIKNNRPFHLANKDQVKNAKNKLTGWVKRYGKMYPAEITRLCDRASKSEINDSDDVQIIAALASQGMDSDKMMDILDAMTGRGATGGPKLLTIHGCKGLEADRVFLMSDQIPHSKSVKNSNPKVLDQEYNMAYVGATRARNELYIVAEKDENPDGLDVFDTDNVLHFMEKFRAGKLKTKPFKPLPESEVVIPKNMEDSIVMDSIDLDEINSGVGSEEDIWGHWENNGPQD